jgi:hypothetical protein
MPRYSDSHQENRSKAGYRVMISSVGSAPTTYAGAANADVLPLSPMLVIGRRTN